MPCVNIKIMLEDTTPALQAQRDSDNGCLGGETTTERRKAVR